MNEREKALFQKARRALDTARVVVELGDAEAAISRAYYAAFYAATAALLSIGETQKTHKGTHQRFHFRFVASGEISPAVGEVISHAFDLRQRADYEAVTVFDVKAAADLIDDVQVFVDTVEGLVRR